MNFPLVGNENVKKAVEGIFLSGRIPHALLIEGDEGLGRNTLAGFIASAAVCTGDDIPCGLCRGCHLASVGTHPDISIVSPEDGKKNISVAKIRELRAEVFVKAHSAGHRVFIITEAEKMNEQAQNALLKVLEEPPAGVIFILIVTSRTAMLETIISRCTVLTLSAPTGKQAAEYLSEILSLDLKTVDEALLKTDNNIGKARLLLMNSAQEASDVAAKKFSEIIFSGSELDMLRILIPFEKDRNGTDAFFSKLKVLVANEIKNNYRSTMKAKKLTELYSYLTECEERLKTNINLPLMFSALVCKVKDIVNF